MTAPIERDYTLEEAADVIRMSSRWIREQIKAGEQGKGTKVEHVRRGHKILFTREQVEKLRALHVKAVVAEPVTTGPTKGRRSA